MWSIGSIAFLGVTAPVDGFDRPSTATLVTLLGDGTSTRDQVLQQGATPFSQATVTGSLTEAADVATLRAYYHSKETVTFTDPNNVATDVRVLELRIVDLTLWWDFTMVLLESDEQAETPGVGQIRTGLATTLAADPALGAVILKVASVTTVAAGDFVRAGPAGVTATAANSEVLRVLTVGTTGSGGTGLGVENDAGGGCLLDHANADELKTVNGTLLAAPALAGAKNVKVDSVSALVIGGRVRIGYAGHFDTRTLTVIGTTGATGTGLTFAVPLAHDHSLDEWVIEVV